MRALTGSVAAAVTTTALAVGLAAGVAACAGRAGGGGDPGATPLSANPLPRTTPLPPIPPDTTGPLAIALTVPRPNQAIDADSNFIFGVVGRGDATLAINGVAVPVAPNGAFLAFLPVPRGDAPAYQLIASRGPDTARLTVPIRRAVPRTPLPLDDRLTIDSASVTPRAPASVSATAGPPAALLRDDDPVRVAARVPANAAAWVRLDSAGREQRRLLLLGDGELRSAELPARLMRRGGTLVVARGRDTLRLPLAAAADPDTALPVWVTLGAPDSARGDEADDAAVVQNDTDRVVIGSPIPGGTYKWLLLPGTVVRLTGQSGEFARVRLDDRLEVWVSAGETQRLPPGTAAPRRLVGSARLVPEREWVDVVFPMSSRPPFLVEQYQRTLVLTMYGTQANPPIIPYLGNDSLVRVIQWVPEATDRVRFTLELSRQPYGYLAFWDAPRRAFVLRLRRPPPAPTDPARPLSGLTIVVDAGHPPGGAMGPTGLWEPVAALAVSERLRTMLEARGAQVVMTRTTPDPVALSPRSVVARRANAHALISVHLNAFGDGTNPFTQNGTSTLFYHPQTEPLARLVQRGMIASMGLRDLGIHYQNIAIGRTSWMPALITEGLFLMIPEQEHAMRTPEGQEAYARGVAWGVEEYFRTMDRR